MASIILSQTVIKPIARFLYQWTNDKNFDVDAENCIVYGSVFKHFIFHGTTITRLFQNLVAFLGVKTGLTFREMWNGIPGDTPRTLVLSKNKSIFSLQPTCIVF